MRSLGWTLAQGDWNPYRRKLGHRHTERKDHMKTQGRDSQGERFCKKSALWTVWCPTSSSAKNSFPLLKPSSLWYCVTAAWAIIQIFFFFSWSVKWNWSYSLTTEIAEDIIGLKLFISKIHTAMQSSCICEETGPRLWPSVYSDWVIRPNGSWTPQEQKKWHDISDDIRLRSKPVHTVKFKPLASLKTFCSLFCKNQGVIL